MSKILKNLEIERKFLVLSLPLEIILEQYKSFPISQGYLAKTNTSVVRLRSKGDKYYLTYKSSQNNTSLARTELECSLNETQFNTLWPGTLGHRLEKTRYEIPFGKYLIELDLFCGQNTGYILAEVEFNNMSEAKNFIPPSWFFKEVTRDKNYTNPSIALHGFPKK